MKENGSPNFNTGEKRGKARKRALVVSLITILAFAALPLGSVFAAPIGGNGNNNNDLASWNQKVQNLRADVAVSKNIVTIPGRAGLSAQEERWLDLYMADLRAAQALAAGRFSTGTAGRYYQMHPDKLLAMYLHDLRVLRAELGLSACPNNINRAAKDNNTLIACFMTGVNAGSTTGTSTSTGTGAATATPMPSATPSPATSPTPSPTP